MMNSCTRRHYVQPRLRIHLRRVSNRELRRGGAVDFAVPVARLAQKLAQAWKEGFVEISILATYCSFFFNSKTYGYITCCKTMN